MTPLGLPRGVRACLFDLDGVLTETATVHAAAWKDMFDAYLQQRSAASGEAPFVPFDIVNDYALYVDGKPRADGTRGFLESRGIHLPQGDVTDPPQRETIHGLGNRKNALVQRRLQQQPVEVCPGSLRYLQQVRAAGLHLAVVSSSANTRAILAAAGLADYFEACVDGLNLEREHLRGKPAPDTYVAAARALGASPPEAAVFEDALVGVQAGRAGGFGYVVGIGHGEHAQLLADNGADIVVPDLSALLEPHPAG